MFLQNVVTYLTDCTAHFQDCNPELYIHIKVKLMSSNISALKLFLNGSCQPWNQNTYLRYSKLKDIIDKATTCLLVRTLLCYLLQQNWQKLYPKILKDGEKIMYYVAYDNDML
jgi:hypothetical protein